jgi:peptidoglycan/LPS O-acetylase OafA/YrhL
MDKPNFEPRLESLRGIAALIVAIAHGMTTFTAGPADRPFVIWQVNDWLFWFTNPASAVFFFFVLSGYVLGQSLQRDFSYVNYGIRRAFRILPAFIASVLFAYICIAPFRYEPGPSDLSDFFRTTHPALQLVDIWNNLTFRNTYVNGPSWSIYPEIFGSAVLPVFVYLHRRIPGKFGLLAFVVVSALLALTPIRIALWFYAGYFLPPLIARYLPNDWLVRLAVFCAGLFLIRYFGPGSNVSKMDTIAPSAFGGVLMISSVISSQNFLNWLRLPSLRFLGRVSYSFYLVHWPVFYLTALLAMHSLWFPHGFTGNAVICAISVMAALALAAASYRWIELPSISAGKFISRSFAGKPRQPLPDEVVSAKPAG